MQITNWLPLVILTREDITLDLMLCLVISYKEINISQWCCAAIVFLVGLHAVSKAKHNAALQLIARETESPMFKYRYAVPAYTVKVNTLNLHLPLFQCSLTCQFICFKNLHTYIPFLSLPQLPTIQSEQSTVYRPSLICIRKSTLLCSFSAKYNNLLGIIFGTKY